jgi:tetratricopeptide (TPR) repeat protein
VPKIIDFGLAKAMHQPLTEHTLYTAHGLMVGTPLYMSPEQAEFNNLDVDTRTDVYSLGVILYELLTGATPLEKQKFKDAALQEMLRLIKEEEPLKPSMKLSTSASLPTVAAQRSLDAAQLSRAVRGDLDWIVMKALEKERSRRYETANGLAKDVERYLNDDPVEACPPSLGYKLRKLARRNKRALVTASILGVALVVALVVVAGSIGWAVRDRQTRQAVVEGEVLLALTEAESLYQQNKLPEALAAVKQAGGLLASIDTLPEIQARVERWQADLDMIRRLEEIQLKKATSVTDDAFDVSVAGPLYQAAFQDYGLDLKKDGPEATARTIQNVRIKHHLVAALDDWALLSEEPLRKQLWAVARESDRDGWRNRLRNAVEVPDKETLKSLAGDDELLVQLPTTITILGVELEKLGERTKAIDLLHRAQRRYPRDFWINVHLGRLLLETRQFFDAPGVLQSALATFPGSALTRHYLADALITSGKLAEGEAEYREALRLMPELAVAHHNLSFVLERQEKHDDAEAGYREAIRLRPTSAFAHASLGAFLNQKEKVDAAETEFLEAVRLAPDDWLINDSYLEFVKTRNRLKQAEARLRDAINKSPNDGLLHRQLGDILSEGGQRDEAKAAYADAVRTNARDYFARTRLGFLLADERQPTEAENSFREAIAINQDFVWAQLGLAEVCVAQSKFQEAEAAASDMLLESILAMPARMLLSRVLRQRPRSAEDMRGYLRQPSRVLGLALEYYDGHWIDAIRLARMPSKRNYVTTLQTSNSASEALSQGAQLVGAGNYTAAVNLYRAAIRTNPANFSLHYRLTGVLIRLRQFDAALTSGLEAVRLNPNSPAAHYNLGLVYGATRNWKEEEAMLRAAVRLDRNLAVAHSRLGQVLQRLGNSDEALAAGREAVRIEPMTASLHARLSWILKQQGKIEEADEVFEEAFRLSEANFGARAFLSATYGKFEAAEKYFAEDVRANPNDTFNQMNLALVRWKLGDRSGYEEVCRDILTRFAQNPVPGTLERVAKSCLWGPQPVGDIGELKRMADLSVKNGWNDPYLSYFLFAQGLAAYRAGEFEDALTSCRESRAKNALPDEMSASAGGPSTLATKGPDTSAKDGQPILAKDQPIYAPLNAYSLVVEAMALHQQKKSDEARKAYDDAAAIIAECFPDAPDELGPMWEGWLIHDILNREASALLSIDAD